MEKFESPVLSASYGQCPTCGRQIIEDVIPITDYCNNDSIVYSEYGHISNLEWCEKEVRRINADGKNRVFVHTINNTSAIAKSKYAFKGE